MKLKAQKGGGGFEKSELGVFMDVLSVNVGTLSGVGAATVAEQNVTVAGLDTSDVVLRVEKPTHQAGLACTGGRVSASDTLTLQFSNPTAGSITPTASEVYKVVMLRINK